MDYEKTVNIESNKELVYKALTEEIDKWWTSIENTANKEGDIFKISFGTESYWKFKVLDLKNSESVVWECVESHQDHNLQGMDDEWLNSKLYWNISNIDGNVKVQFLHKGLVSTGVCYEVCSSAWDFYILDSLKRFLETGVGKPGEK
jgi:uncharacterized protein YndB with AHSA1/START domain